MTMFSNNKCEEILSKYGLNGNVLSCRAFGSGHINNTFLINFLSNNGKNIKYVLQAVNSNVFKNIYEIMENIRNVTDFIKNKSVESKFLDFLQTDNGNTLYVDDSGVYWRVYRFIENSVTVDMPETDNDLYQCAYAFGKFQRDLADFPAESLHEIIPDFHNTFKRYRAFLDAVEKDICCRAHKVESEIDFIKSRSDFYGLLDEKYRSGILPLRVSHNDTKCNNVLLDCETRKAVCVIDLDTIMPGFSVNDFGDAVRFGTSTAAEDETDLSKVHFDFDKFKIYARGFLDGCDGLLTDEEIMLLPEGAKMMTAECGMRFLTDYLEGDTYFKTEREEQNLDRCRTQLKLVSEMENNWNRMKACVSEFTGK